MKNEYDEKEEKEEKSEESYNTKPYKEDERHVKVAQFVDSFKKKYFDNSEFKRYKNKCNRVLDLIDQKWGQDEMVSRYGLKFAVTRASHDSQIDAMEEVFDTNDWVRAKPLIETKEVREESERLQYYTNNLLHGARYREHIKDRVAYIPAYGWSITFTEYFYAMGKKIKAQAKENYEGSLPWDTMMDAVMDGVKPTCIHPYNWFGDPNKGMRNQNNQGFIKRWQISDVVSAMGKKASDETSLYNEKALEKMKTKLSGGESVGDSNYHESENTKEDENNASYIDVSYYIGRLNGCDGYYGDPNTYVIECFDDCVLRIYEHPVDDPQYYPISHGQTNPRIDVPFPRTPLDAIIPHALSMDMLANRGLEVAVDSQASWVVLDEDDWLNPETLKQPQGVINMLYLKAGRGGRYTKPQAVETNNTGALRDTDTMLNLLDFDRQRGGGSTDQELGIGGGGASTATQARILASQLSRSTRGRVRRLVQRGILPEIRYMLLLSLMHSSPEEKLMYSEEGNEIELTPQMMLAYLENSIIEIDDNIIRDRNMDAVERMEFFELVMNLTQKFQDPHYGVMVARAVGREKGVPQDVIDEFLPKPDMSEVTQPQQPQMPGMPGDPAQAMQQGMPQGQQPRGVAIPEVVERAKRSLEQSQPLNPIQGTMP